MRKKHEPACGWLSRLLRGRRFDHNPLRRTSDRAETAILAGVLIALLAGAPFAALGGGDFAHNLARATQQRQQATERQVTAVTVEAAPQPQQSRVAYTAALARWTAPDGKQVADDIPVPAGTPVGTRELAWTTLNGQLAAPPLLDSQVDDLTTLGQATSVVALVVALTLGWAGVRRGLERRRFAAWDADWQAIDHRGTRRT